MYLFNLGKKVLIVASVIPKPIAVQGKLLLSKEG